MHKKTAVKFIDLHIVRVKLFHIITFGGTRRFSTFPFDIDTFPRAFYDRKCFTHIRKFNVYPSRAEIIQAVSLLFNI